MDLLSDNLKESDSFKEFVDVMERHEPEQYCLSYYFQLVDVYLESKVVPGSLSVISVALRNYWLRCSTNRNVCSYQPYDGFIIVFAS